MKTEDAKHLLDLYYEGNISSQDKQMLLEYFSGNNVSPELVEEGFIFKQIHKGEEIEIPNTMEQEIISVIDNQEGSEKFQQLVSQKKKRNLSILFRIAAVGIFVVLSTIFILQKTEKEENKYYAYSQNTFSDPEVASIEVQKALCLVSTKFNKGLNKLDAANQDLDKMNRIVNYSLNTLIK